MYFDITNEYMALLKQKCMIESELKTCPKGYIYKKKIGDKEYAYLKYRNGTTVESVYLKNNEAEEIESKLNLRKTYEEKLPKINSRLIEIERAAGYLSNALSRQLNVLKLSIPMESLSSAERFLSLSFSDAMTSIEGIQVTDDLRNTLSAWQNGKKTFSSIFTDTLRQYGFLTEV